MHIKLLLTIWSAKNEYALPKNLRLSRYCFGMNWNLLNIDSFIKRGITDGEINIMPLTEKEKELWTAYQSEVSKPISEMNDAELTEFVAQCEATIFEAKAKQAKAQAEMVNRYARAKKSREEMFGTEAGNGLKSPKSYREQKHAAKKAPVNLFGNQDMNELLASIKAKQADKEKK